MKRETIQRLAPPTAILVGVAEPLATTCTDVLADGGMRVLRVGHVAAACERIPVTMPQIVVVSTSLESDDAEMLADRCVAVGAEVIKLSPEAQMDSGLSAMLKNAGNRAKVRSLRRGF